MSELIDLALDSIRRLDRWLTQNGWAGYDPYDLRGLPLFTNTDPILVEKIARKAIYVAQVFSPLLVRSILQVRKEINAKAMGLFVDGYLTLYQVTNDITYLKKAEEALQWLSENYSRGYSGKCWGYPFDWKSRIFIIYKIKGHEWKVKIPYVHWGQAWMLKGLSKVCRLESGPIEQ